MTAEEQALKAAIAADPKDDTARLALADYWAETGRPDLEWLEREVVAARPVLADPEDDGERLAFADFCDLHGRAGRAAWIRLGVEMAAKPPCPSWCDHDPARCDRARLAKELEGAASACRLWTPPHGSCHFVPADAALSDAELGPFSQVYVHKGFAHAVTTSGKWWLRNAPDLCLRHPIERCILRTMPAVEWADEMTMDRREAFNNPRRKCWFRVAPALSADIDYLMFPQAATHRIQMELLRKYWPGVKFFGGAAG